MTNEGPEAVDFTAMLDSAAALDVDTDTLFDVFSDERRRFVVACLQTYATPMALSDVADELATWERDAPITEIPAEDVTAVYTSLYHVHVPKMAEAGIVEYSQERDAVALAIDADDIASGVPLPTIT